MKFPSTILNEEIRKLIKELGCELSENESICAPNNHCFKKDSYHTISLQIGKKPKEILEHLKCGVELCNVYKCVHLQNGESVCEFWKIFNSKESER